jgi:phosphatidylcholine synthase
LRLPPGPTLVVIAVFAVLTFVPVRFVHPFRVRRFRALTVALLALWGGLAFVAVLHGLSPGFPVTASLCAIGLYFFAIGLLPLRQH